jgi:hypothetical protein
MALVFILSRVGKCWWWAQQKDEDYSWNVTPCNMIVSEFSEAPAASIFRVKIKLGVGRMVYI